MLLSQSWDILRKASKSSEKLDDAKSVTCEVDLNPKRQKMDGDVKNTETKFNDEPDLNSLKLKLEENGSSVKCCKIEDLYELFNLPKTALAQCKNNKTELVTSDLTPHNFVKAVSDPQVISLVCKLLKENLNFR